MPAWLHVVVHVPGSMWGYMCLAPCGVHVRDHVAGYDGRSSPSLQVMDQSVALITEAKAAVEDPTAPNKQLRLAQAAKAVSQALNQVTLTPPSAVEPRSQASRGFYPMEGWGRGYCLWVSTNGQSRVCRL